MFKYHCIFVYFGIFILGLVIWGIVGIVAHINTCEIGNNGHCITSEEKMCRNWCKSTDYYFAPPIDGVFRDTAAICLCGDDR